MYYVKHALAFVIALTLTCEWVSAHVIFSTIGPGNSYSTGFAYDVTSPSSYTDFDRAMGFSVSGGNYTLDSISLAVINPFNNIGGGSVLDVFLMTDSSGTPGSVIESLQITLPAPLFSGVLSATSSLNPTLHSGSNYFLAVSAQQPNSFLGWHFDANGFALPSGPSLFRINGGPWVENGFGTAAFRLDGSLTAVPEPSSIVLFGLTLIGGTMVRRRMRNGG